MDVPFTRTVGEIEIRVEDEGVYIPLTYAAFSRFLFQDISDRISRKNYCANNSISKADYGEERCAFNAFEGGNQSPGAREKLVTYQAIAEVLDDMARDFPNLHALLRRIERNKGISFDEAPVLSRNRKQYNFQNCDKADQAIREILNEVSSQGFDFTVQFPLNPPGITYYLIYKKEGDFTAGKEPIAGFVYDTYLGSEHNPMGDDQIPGNRANIRFASGTSKDQHFLERIAENAALQNDGVIPRPKGK